MNFTDGALTALATSVAVTADSLIVELADGRTISVPLVWFPRLLKAEPTARNQWELIGDGHGIRWPDLDEDIGVADLLRSKPSSETRC